MLFGAVGFFVSAILGILSFPPIGLSPLGWIALVPFLAAATSLSPRKALRYGYLAGFVFFIGVLYWIMLNTGAPPVLRVLSGLVTFAVLGTIWGITAWGVSFVHQRFGLVWAMGFFVVLYGFQEVFWGVGELSFPWAILALSQSSLLWFIQIADIADFFGLSFWILTVNVLVFLTWRLRENRKRAMWALIIVFLFAPLYGIFRLATLDSGRPLNVAAVQGNIPALEKWQMAAEDIIDVYLRETLSLTSSATQLVVWPETAAPVALRYRQWARDKLQNFADSSGMGLFTGGTDYEKGGDDPLPLNAAFYFRPNRTELLSTAKTHLVPFGERIPGQKLFPFLGKIRLGQAEFAPAKTPTVFPVTDQIPEMGCLVCYEVIFPEVAAQLIRGGAKILTNVTQDGWFTGSSEPYQHLDLTRLRAVATRRSIVRAANSGISALILPTGATVKTLGDGVAGHVVGPLPVQSSVSLAIYLYPFWFPFYSILLLGMIIYLRLRSRSVKQSG